MWFNFLLQTKKTSLVVLKDTPNELLISLSEICHFSRTFLKFWRCFYTFFWKIFVRLHSKNVMIWLVWRIGYPESAKNRFRASWTRFFFILCQICLAFCMLFQIFAAPSANLAKIEEKPCSTCLKVNPFHHIQQF